MRNVIQDFEKPVKKDFLQAFVNEEVVNHTLTGDTSVILAYTVELPNIVHIVSVASNSMSGKTSC